MPIIGDCALNLFSQKGGPSPGLVTSYDKSRYHHDVALHNITWVQNYDNGLWQPVFNGTSAYMDATHAATEGLGITNDLNSGYTIMGWINWTDTTQSEIVIGRYELDVGGWEIYLTYTGGVYSLTQRHHHAGTVVDAHPRSASYSEGWTEGTNWWMAIVFPGTGTDCIHYRNGVPVVVASSTGGIRAFEATDQELVIGIRYSGGANWYEGTMCGLRVYPYIWTPGQVRNRYEAEKSNH